MPTDKRQDMNLSTTSVSTWQPQPLELLQTAAYRFLTHKKLWMPARHSRRGPRNLFLRLLRFFLVAFLWLNCLYFGSVSLICTAYIFTNPATSSLMITRAFQGTAVKPVQFIPFKQIPQNVRSVFIELEDHDFYAHHGISLGAIKDAMLLNKQLGRTVSGGSTITQQLARNLFLNPDKNYVRKYLEAGTAILMELILGKKRILELYLNYIEFGPGAFGLGRGALYQYKTVFSELDYEQRVRLAVIITSPLRYTVNTFYKNRGMWARYLAIMGPPPEPETPVAPSAQMPSAPTPAVPPPAEEKTP